jgi:hypothetical protein
MVCIKSDRIHIHRILMNHLSVVQFAQPPPLIRRGSFRCRRKRLLSQRSMFTRLPRQSIHMLMLYSSITWCYSCHPWLSSAWPLRKCITRNESCQWCISTVQLPLYVYTGWQTWLPLHLVGRRFGVLSSSVTPKSRTLL